MKAKDKILKAKVHLQKDNPFFAYLVMNLDYKENSNIESIGVSAKGECAYNSKWVEEEVTDEQLKGILAHEVLHLALQHLERWEGKNKELFNVSADLVINNILKVNDFELPRGLTPYNNEFEFQDGTIVEDLDKKTAEEVYNELNKNENFKKHIKVEDDRRFDEHEYGEGNGDEKQAEIKEKWNKAVGEASVYARQQGNLPKGMERALDIIMNEKVNWKHLIYKHLQKTLPYDYTYSRPSKKSFSTGFYMPSILRENVDVVVSIDTSGSLDKEELSEFLGEITSMARMFNNIKITLIVCDYEIHEVYELTNNDIDDLTNLVMSGGGGTSHIPIYDYVKENIPNAKLLINFTDGYTDFPDDMGINSVWVLTKGACSNERIPFGEIIRLD